MILKLFRNGLGAIVAFTSWVFAPHKITRTEAEQKIMDDKTKNLELYQFFGCPFCVKVRRVIRALNLKIITRDAQNDIKYRTELLEQGGEIKVPCLKIVDNNTTKWLYESDDIIKYLQDNFT